MTFKLASFFLFFLFFLQPPPAGLRLQVFSHREGDSDNTITSLKRRETHVRRLAWVPMVITTFNIHGQQSIVEENNTGDVHLHI